jgi:hypothetical protein
MLFDLCLDRILGREQLSSQAGDLCFRLLRSLGLANIAGQSSDLLGEAIKGRWS